MIRLMCKFFKSRSFSCAYSSYFSETVKAPVTPSKKRNRPSPGTPEFDLLPAVSLTYVFIVLALYSVLGLYLKGANWKQRRLRVPLLPLSVQYCELKLRLSSFLFVVLTSVFSRPVHEGRPK